MNPAILQNQFVQVALPIIIITIAIAAFMNNRAFDGVYKALDAVNHRLDDIVARLGRIEVKLEDHADRIARLEERTSPLRGR